MDIVVKLSEDEISNCNIPKGLVSIVEERIASQLDAEAIDLLSEILNEDI